MEEVSHSFIENEFSISTTKGLRKKNISDTVRVSVGYVSKVVKNYENNNISFPPMRKLPARDVVTEDVMEYIESEKLYKPSMYTKEIQQRLLLDGVSPPNHLPSQSAIKECIQNDCKIK